MVLKFYSHALQAYDAILDMDEIEHVGTRLHAGIRAMQKKKRSIILAIDSRAKEMKKDINIPSVEREDIEGLERKIRKSFSTDVKIPLDAIEKWKNQFI